MFVKMQLIVLVLLWAVACGGDRSVPAVRSSPDAARTEATASPSATERADQERRRPPIVVETPKPGQKVRSPVTIAGTANVFEATVGIRIRGEDGSVIFRGFTTATCGSGCRGDFSEAVAFDVDKRQDGVIEAFEPAVTDEGGRPFVVRVPVVLLP